MKQCIKCLENKDLMDFYKRKISKDGFTNSCRLCCKKGLQLWRQNNPEKIKNLTSKWQKNNKEARRKILKKWQRNNLKARCANEGKRRATKLNATPVWADLEKIKIFYINCPKGYHVDHIIPLRGKNVCGLHVLENLQYLKAIDNIKKSNKFEIK